MPEAVIVDTIRTPIGRAFKGSLAQLRPEEMGAFVVDQLLERNPGVDPALIEDVFCGVGMPQGLEAFNIGRIVSLLCEKLPQEVNGVTVSRYCSSSLDAIRRAGNAIKAGEGDVYLAAGVEWVSSFNERTEPAGAADRNPNLIGENGQPNAYIDMGITAVNVAKKYEVSRADMDKFAQRSQERAVHPRRTASSTAKSSRSSSRTGPKSPRTTAPAPPRPWRSSPNCRRPSVVAASPPATPARSTTAPPRCC